MNCYTCTTESVCGHETDRASEQKQREWGSLTLSLIWKARDLHLNLQSELMWADCPWPHFVQTATDYII